MALASSYTERYTKLNVLNDVQIVRWWMAV